MEKPRILLIDEQPARRSALKKALLSTEFTVAEADRLVKIPDLDREKLALVVLVCDQYRSHQLVALSGIGATLPHTPVFVVAPSSSEELAIAALRAGVRDYFRAPYSLVELLTAIHKTIRAAAEHGTAGIGLEKSSGLHSKQPIIGRSKSVTFITGYLRRVAARDCNVLITGETGTGKQLVAELIHKESTRRLKPFVSINCAAIPDTLLESELFGYERGAFTGADLRSSGKLASGDGGTVFLDEVGDMSAYAQAKMLHVIDCKYLQRLGSPANIAADIRIVAATNKDLEKLASENSFRRDLYFRLNVVTIHMPSLRERKEDIPTLVHYYIDVLNRNYGLGVRGLSEAAMNRLVRYDWPGNIRELKNTLESIYVNGPPVQIQTTDLPERIRRSTIEQRLDGSDQERLVRVLAACKWNKSKAAERLRWSRMTIYRKMARYNITPSSMEISEDTCCPVNSRRESVG